MNIEATTRATRRTVVLRMPIDALVFAFENHPEYSLEGFRVKNKRRFALYVAEQLLQMEDPETGDPLWGQAIDKIFTEAIESGEDFISSPAED